MRGMDFYGGFSDKFEKLRKKTAWLLLAVFWLQPTAALAQAVPDANAPNQKRPSVVVGSKNVPVVNIAAPSGAGISHNLFQQFNVDKQGLILNNSTVAVETQLAGNIAGNDNLGGVPARIILNEVTGTNQSNLNGLIEVAGQKADVIIANPNGISGSGFGFINVGRAVLTTGTPVFGGSGSLDYFRVTGGQISIDGDGMDAKTVDRADLISRAISINANIYAKEINVVSGANNVNYNTLNVETIKGSGTNPAVAIDIGDLGGMYANKIKLVGTENGVGFASKGLLESQGDLVLTNQGKIILAGTIHAGNNIQITGSDDISHNSTTHAVGNISLSTATGKIENTDVLSAGQNIDISAKTISSSGTIGSGIVNGEGKNAGNLTITAADTFSTTGQQIAGGDIGISAQSISHNGAVTSGAATVDIKALNGEIDNTGGVISGNAVKISASNAFKNNVSSEGQAASIVAGSLSITAKDIQNQGSVIRQGGADGATINAGSTLDNTNGTILTSGKGAAITASSIDNSQGQIRQEGTGSLSVTTGKINNKQGLITSDSILGIAVQGDLTNDQGVIKAGQNLTVASGALSNQSGNISNIGSGDTKLTITNSLNNTNGTITGNGSLELTTTELNNRQGQVQGSGKLSITVDIATDNTSGKLVAGSDLSLNLGSNDLNNNLGIIQSGQNISIQGAGVNNGGQITGRDIQIQATAINNEGKITAAKDISLQGQDINNKAGFAITAGNNITIQADKTYLNNGQVDGAVINVNGEISKKSGASVAADPKVSWSRRPIIDVAPNGVDLVQISSALTAGVSRNLFTTFDVGARGLILNNSTTYTKTKLGGYIDGNARLGNQPARVILNEVTGPSISNLNGFIEVAGSKAAVVIANPNGIIGNGFGFINASRGVLTTGLAKFNSGGQLSSFDVTNGEIKVRAFGLNTDNRLDLVGRNIQIDGGVWATNFNMVAGANQVSYDNLKAQAISGTPTSQQGVTVGQTGGIYANNITIASTEAGAAVVNQGTISAAGSSNITVNDSFINTGMTISAGDTKIAATGNLENSGAIVAKGNASLYTEKNLENKEGGIIYSSGDITIAGSATTGAEAVINQSATIEAGGNLNIKASQITNKKSEFVTGWTVTNQNYAFSITPLANHYAATRKYNEVIQTGGIWNETPEGQLLAGNNLSINGSLTNQFSTVIAGNDLSITGPQLTNIGYQNTTIYTDKGKNIHYWKIAHHNRFHIGCWDEYGTTEIPYYLQRVVETNGTRPGIIGANNKVTINAGTVNNITVDAGGNTYTADSKITPAKPGLVSTATPGSKLTVTKLDPTAKYLVEVDPRFADYKTFLSSDYLLARILTDPTKVMKRLGDGFYEQKLIRDQITEMTGRLLLSGYSSDEAEYQALMNNASYYAKTFKLKVGIALTAEQMAQLTSDMVWLVEQEVQGQKVLVPVVYLAKTGTGELRTGGALISGKDIELVNAADLSNQGVIQGNNAVNLKAQNITNQSGTISGQTVNLEAAQDIKNQGGSIVGQDVSLKADGNIINETTSSTVNYGALTDTKLGPQGIISGQGNVSLQAKDVVLKGAVVGAGQNLTINADNSVTIDTVAKDTRVAVVFNKSKANLESSTHLTSTLLAGGAVTITAKNDIDSKGAQISGGGDITLSAGGNVSLAAVKDRNMQDVEVGQRGSDYFNRKKNDDEAVVGTSIAAGGNISITATKKDDKAQGLDKGNITVSGGSISSDAGKITLTADKDITIKGETEKHEALSETHIQKVGVLATTVTDTYDHSQVSEVKGSAISGDSISINANRDIGVSGSSVVGTNDVALTAATGKVTISAAEETSKEEHYKQVTKSGLLTSGLSFTIGKQSQKTTDDISSTGNVGSMVGSTSGKVAVTASQDIKVAGSDIIGEKGVDITGKNISIEAVTHRVDEKQTYEFKQSGLTVGLGGQLIENINSVYNPLKRSTEVRDERLKALYGYKAIKAGDNLLHGKNGDGTKKGTALSLNISFGRTEQKSETTINQQTVQGSTIQSNGDINIKTTGEKDASGRPTEGTIDITASTISGNNVDIAARTVNLRAGKNTSKSNSESSGSSMGIGVEIGLGKNKQGVGVTVSASKQNGSTDENSLTYTYSDIFAKNKLSITTGQDLNIIGGKAQGDIVSVDVGRNLNIQSLQDTATYNEKNRSVGGSLSIGSGVSVNISASKGKINSDYQSVTEQSGIYAGKGGFDIKVGGNTDLKGAVIASDAIANKLSTGSLTYSDIQNHADYDSKSIGVNYDSKKYDKGDPNYKNQGLTPNIGVSAKGSGDSTTKSGISVGTIIVGGKKVDPVNLNRDTTNTLNTLGKIFDKKTVQERQELAGLFGEEAFKLIGDLGLKEDDPKKVALKAVVGGIMSQMTGGSFTSGATSAGLTQVIQNELGKIKDPATLQWVSGIIGGTVSKLVGGNAQTGASISISDERNNWLWHYQQKRMAELLWAAQGDREKVANIFAYYTALNNHNVAHTNELDWLNQSINSGEAIQMDLYNALSPYTSNLINLNATLNEATNNIFGVTGTASLYRGNIDSYGYNWGPSFTYVSTPTQSTLNDNFTNAPVNQQNNQVVILLQQSTSDTENNTVISTEKTSGNNTSIFEKLTQNVSLFGDYLKQKQYNYFQGWYTGAQPYLGLNPTLMNPSDTTKSSLWYTGGSISAAFEFNPAVSMITNGYIYSKVTPSTAIPGIIKNSNIDETSTIKTAEGSSKAERPSWRQSEKDVSAANPEYETQKSFKNGEEVSYGTKGSVRPDNYKEGVSIEVKNYDVATASGRNRLVDNITKQVEQRIEHLPTDTSQKVVIDVRGQNVSNDVLREIRDSIVNKTGGNIEIQFLR